MQDQENQGSPSVSFPTVGEPPKKNTGAKTLLIAGILILVGILGFVIFRSASSSGDTITIEPSPDDSLTTPVIEDVATPIPTATASATPSASAAAVAKSAVAIEIQNGTGVPGEAAYLQTQLTSLGYSKISVGNAASQNATETTVTFAKSLSATVVDEITKKLESVYTKVTAKTATTQSMDVLIVTGPRKGVSAATTRPVTSATGTPRPSGSATPRASTSPTPTTSN